MGTHELYLYPGEMIVASSDKVMTTDNTSNAVSILYRVLSTSQISNLRSKKSCYFSSLEAWNLIISVLLITSAVS